MSKAIIMSWLFLLASHMMHAYLILVFHTWPYVINFELIDVMMQQF